MPQTAQAILATTQLLIDPETYMLVQVHPRGVTAVAAIIAELSEPFTAMIVDPFEITLFIEQEAYEEYAPRLIGHILAETRYRLITFDAILEPTLTGFMAAIAHTLAQTQVPILPLAAYNRDHIFVPAEKLDIALNALHQLQKENQ